MEIVAKSTADIEATIAETISTAITLELPGPSRTPATKITPYEHASNPLKINRKNRPGFYSHWQNTLERGRWQGLKDVRTS